MYKTYQPKAKEITRNWHLIDAKDKILGRLSTDIVKLLMGKHKADYSAHMDSGDYIVLVNAGKVKVTGQKEDKKIYYKHSGYPGGYKEIKYQKWLTESPEKIIQHAVSGMLPDNRLKDKRMRRLKIFSEGEHSYKDKFKESNKVI